jgi:hypothetical protein
MVCAFECSWAPVALTEMARIPRGIWCMDALVTDEVWISREGRYAAGMLAYKGIMLGIRRMSRKIISS